MANSNSRVTTSLYKHHLLKFYFLCYVNHKKIFTLNLQRKITIYSTIQLHEWLVKFLYKANIFKFNSTLMYVIDLVAQR